MKSFLPLAALIVLHNAGLQAADERFPPGKRPTEKPAAPAPRPSPQASLGRLANFLAEMKSSRKATPEQRRQLESDLSALAAGATKPSEKSVGKFAGDLALTIAGHNAVSSEQQALAKNILVLFNCAALSASEVETILGDVRRILKSAGLSKEDAERLAEDLQTIVTEVRTGAAN